MVLQRSPDPAARNNPYREKLEREPIGRDLLRRAKRLVDDGGLFAGPVGRKPECEFATLPESERELIARIRYTAFGIPEAPRPSNGIAFHLWYLIKTGKPLSNLVVASQRNLAALRQLTQFELEYLKNPSFRGRRTKFNPWHVDLLQLGSGLGIEKLTAEERTEYLDDFCPACTSIHSVKITQNLWNVMKKEMKHWFGRPKMRRSWITPVRAMPKANKAT